MLALICRCYRFWTFSLFVLMGLLTVGSSGAQTPIAEAVIDTYKAFATAQNSRDVEAIRTFFIDSPDFLWVSDGKSFWAPDPVLRRMSSFQRAEVWRVEPDLDVARVVEVAPGTALLHMPLTLVVGRAENPNRLRFLVSILFAEQPEGWRIAALLTTGEKP